MNDPRKSVKLIFSEAIDIADPTARARYLAETCGSDADLLRDVEELIAAHEKALSFLNPATDAEPATILSATPLTEREGSLIGRYKLLEKLGEGGFGAVYVAEQREPVKRRVAVKLIKLGMDTKQVVARFEAERQALALMDHPNIAKVLDASSTDSGRPYFVMELVRGVPMTRYCDENHLPTRERLDLFIKVCHAIQHAHQKGIIHRDIKPSNILVTMHDGVAVPKVIDFGIAKATQGDLTDKTIYTQFQQFIGTPAYISPEQAEMSGLDVDTRSDIYSLGVLLYELLVGKTPFDGRELLASGLDEMRRTIREQEPPRPSTRVSTLDEAERTTTARCHGTDPAKLISLLKGDLDWIVMKCLEKDRTRRYETANGVAMDIKRFLNQEPVVARPPSAVYRLQKALRRNRIAFSAASAVAIALIVGVSVSTWQFVQKSRAYQRALTAENEQRRLRDDAEKARANEVDLRIRAQRDAYAAEIKVAQQALRDGNIFRARQLLSNQRPTPGQEDFRGFEWRYLWQQCRGDEVATIAGHTGPVQCVAVSPDGKLIASGELTVGLVRVWDAATRRELISPLFMGGSVRCVAFSPDGRQIAAGGVPGTVKVWNTTTWEDVGAFEAPDKAERLMFSPNGKWLAVGVQSDEVVKLWDLKSKQSVGTFPGTKSDRPCVAFSPDSRLLAYSLGDNQMRLMEVDAMSEFATLRGHRDIVVHVEFSPDGKTLASASSDTTVRLWDVGQRKEAGSLAGHKRRVTSVTFSPDGQTLATSCIDGTIKLWDTATRAELTTLLGHSEWVNNVMFFPDGRTLVSCSDDKTLKLWDTRPGNRDLILGSWLNVRWWNVSIDRKHLLMVQPNQAVTLWDSTMRTPKAVLPIKGINPAATALSNDGRMAALVETNGAVRMLDLAARKELLTWRVPANSFQAVGFSSDNQHVAVLSGNTSYDLNPDGRSESIRNDKMTVRVFDVVSSKQTSGFEGEKLFWLINSMDGEILVVKAEEKARHLLNARTGQRLVTFNTDSILETWGGIDFSPDKKFAAARTVDGQVCVWDFAGGEPIATFTGHIARSLAFSPDGKILASGAEDSTIKLWDLVHKRELRTLRASSGFVSFLDFSPDLKTLASASHDGVLTLWSLASGRELTVLSDRISPNSVIWFTAGTGALVCSGEDSRSYAFRAPTWEEIESAERKPRQE